MCGFHDNSSDLTHLDSGFLGRLRTAYHRQGNKRVAKRFYGCVSADKQHSNTCCNVLIRQNTLLLRQKHCLFKRFTYSVHNAVWTVEWLTVKDCYGNSLQLSNTAVF